MKNPDIGHHQAVDSLNSSADQVAAFSKLIREIADLGKSSWQFFVGWSLGGLTSLFVIFVVSRYQLLNENETILYYLFAAIVIVFSGLEIHKYFNKINKRIDKLVELVSLSNFRN